MWLLTALIATFAWGAADLFYKKGSKADERFSHLEISVWVGMIMGVCSLALLSLSESFSGIGSVFTGIAKYSPASLSYIISMVIGYAGLRYLELSIISPVQNASGALSCIFMTVYFLAVGQISNIPDEFSVFDITGTVFIIIGVISIAIIEKRLSSSEYGKNSKYRLGALALIFPLLYCLFDTVGTTADGIILNEASGFDLGEIDVLILYGLTFFIFGVCAWIFLLIKRKHIYNPFKRTELPKAVAALFEQAGQVFYIFAMAAKPVLAAPAISAYCIVSLLLSRIFLKEKLRVSQYIAVFAVIAGIILLGISEGLAA